MPNHQHPTRTIPMSKPEGHVPGVQRYSAKLEDCTTQIQMLYLGVQNHVGDFGQITDFISQTQDLFGGRDGPVHYDYAQFVDPQGVPTVFAVAYWTAPEQYTAWAHSDEIASWWADPVKTNGDRGYFWEAFCLTKDHGETIAFKEYIRGLSACSMHSVQPMNESGYWGAARDRMPASAYDKLKGAALAPITYAKRARTRGQDINVVVPKNICIIRSGVSWADCGAEQLDSYNTNIKPKLDLGMDHLRDNPVDTGCLSLRQVDVVDTDCRIAPEGYSVGIFQSLAHLEKWAHEHPTHLAIYSRALMERKKYQDALELRTYHEIYVVNQDTQFRYLNCHGLTGLLPVTFNGC